MSDPGAEKRATILYTSVSGDMIGGGQRSLQQLLQRLDRGRFTPVLACPEEGDFLGLMQAGGIETLIVPTPPLRRFSLACVLRFVRVIRDRRVALIHADHPRQTLYAAIAGRLTRTPVLWHLRVGDPDNRVFEWIIYHLASRIIAVSRAAARRFDGMTTAGRKVSLVYNLVDLSQFSPAIDGGEVRREFGIRDGELLIGTIGQLLPRKGQENVISAVAEMVRSGMSTVRLLVVGRGEPAHTAHLQAIAQRLGIAGHVVFTGRRTDLPAITAALDIAVLASSYVEGLSRVIVEAMASGKPVVATDIGGNREAVQDGVTGILVPPGDQEALVGALRSLLLDAGLRARLGNEARRHAEQAFDPYAYMERIHAVYEELLWPRGRA